MSSVRIKQDLQFREISYIVENPFEQRKTEGTETFRDTVLSWHRLRVVVGN